MNCILPWQACDAGRTVGTRGSEDGVIILDEEHPLGARITLEEGGRIAPFSITCGACGLMCHTRFFSSLGEARAEYESMKPALVALIHHLPNEGDSWDEEYRRAVNGALEPFLELFP